MDCKYRYPKGEGHEKNNLIKKEKKENFAANADHLHDVQFNPGCLLCGCIH
jgi:hypothetical protein